MGGKARLSNPDPMRDGILELQMPNAFKCDKQDQASLVSLDVGNGKRPDQVTLACTACLSVALPNNKFTAKLGSKSQTEKP